MRPRGCLMCRERHIRCNGDRPRCSNCVKRSQRCRYDASLKIRYSEYGLGRDSDSSKQLQLQSSPKPPSLSHILNPSQSPSSHSFTERRVVSDPDEIMLFQFYVDKAGPWLDIVSRDRAFGVTVPRLALFCPVLYYACLAYSAHVLGLTKNLDSSLEERFSSKCIHLLIPMLNNAHSITDEYLLATTVILRMSEQFYEACDDAQRHLQGSFSLIAAENTWSLTGKGLRETSFWVYVREDIRMASILRMPCKLNFECDIDFGEAEDCVWTNRMTYLCARTCNWAFGKKTDYEKARLVYLVDLWHSSLPMTFAPCCFAESGPFPTLSCLAPWHTVGLQFYHFSKILLAPEINTANMLELNSWVDKEILSHARTICAYSLHCRDIGAQINACHLIAYAAQFFSGFEERSKVIAYLGTIHG